MKKHLKGISVARTNIEEEAHRRIAKLAGLMNCSDREALGTACYLWTDSQDILKTHGTREQILEWSHLFNISDAESDAWILALEKARLISHCENGQFKIHGNENQIESRIKRIQKGHKAADVMKKKWKDLKKLGATSKRPPRSLQATSDIPNAIQCNAIQCNSIQTKARQEKIPAEPPPSGDAAKQFIAWYCERFKTRWGNNPPIQPKDAGIAGRLAKGLSAEKQALYLDAYFAMPDAWVIKAKHPINLFESKLNEISVFAQSGTFTTMRQARDADSSASNAILLEKVRRGDL